MTTDLPAAVDLPPKKLCPCGCGRYLPEPVRILHVGPAGAAIEEWLADQDLTLEDIRKQDRHPEYVELRRRTVRFLHDHGWPLARIASFVHRDRNSVRNMLA